LGELNNRYKRVFGTDFPDLLSDDAKGAANVLGLGNEAARYQTGGRVTGGASGSIPGTTGQQQQVVPAGATPGRDATGKIIGYRTADGKVVRF